MSAGLPTLWQLFWLELESEQVAGSIRPKHGIIPELDSKDGGEFGGEPRPRSKYCWDSARDRVFGRDKRRRGRRATAQRDCHRENGAARYGGECHYA